MKSLFEPNVVQEMVGRINKLSSDTKPQWGKMNVAQMLTHAQRPLKVAFDEMKIKRGLIGILFGGMARKQLTKPGPFKRNLPTDKNFVVSGNPDFQKEKQHLIELVQRFGQSKDKLTQDPHPFFGKLSQEEWDKLMWKHLDHHLRQFGN